MAHRLIEKIRSLVQEAIEHLQALGSQGEPALVPVRSDGRRVRR